jgi:hypothetical protein
MVNCKFHIRRIIMTLLLKPIHRDMDCQRFFPKSVCLQSNEIELLYHNTKKLYTFDHNVSTFWKAIHNQSKPPNVPFYATTWISIIVD